VNKTSKWIRLTVSVVLALTSLLSPAATAATSAPHRDHLTVYAAPIAPDVCVASGLNRFGPYFTAAEQEWLTTFNASRVNVGADSWERWQQYDAATRPGFGASGHKWNRTNPYQPAPGW
jgi:hypothetical protein